MGYTDSSGYPTSVTYNGVTMALIGGPTYASSTGARLYGLVAPATGANNVVVTWSSSSTVHCAIIAQSFTDVDATAPTGTAVTGTGTSGTATVTVASVASGELVVDFVYGNEPNGDSITLTVGSGQTEVAKTNAGVNRAWSAMSTEAATGNVVMDWTISDADTRWRNIGVALKPAAATGRRERFTRGLHRGLSGAGA